MKSAILKEINFTFKIPLDMRLMFVFTDGEHFRTCFSILRALEIKYVSSLWCQSIIILESQLICIDSILCQRLWV